MRLWFVPKRAYANSTDPTPPAKPEPTANDGLKLLADALNGFTKTIVDAFTKAPTPAPTPPSVPPTPTPTPPANPTPPVVKVEDPKPVARLVRRGNRLVERPLKEDQKK